MREMSDKLALVILSYLLVTFEQSLGIKVYKSRRNAMEEMTGTKQESKQFFSECEQVNNEKACRLAIDNELIDEWSQCSTTKPTLSEDLPWWKGHLEVPVFVISVNIINADFNMVGETDGLMEFNLLGNGNICYTYTATSSFSSKTFQCDMLADEIEIRSHIAGSVLALCDVTVMGAPLKFHIKAQPDTMELSRCKQSSNKGMYTCNFATDGFSNMDPTQGGCAVMQAAMHVGLDEPPPYWWVSFANPAMIAAITLLTPDKNIREAQVSISNRICNTPSMDPSYTDNIKYTLLCNHFGNEILVKFTRRDIPMIICEVQARGFLVQMLPESRRTKIGCFNDKPDDPDMGARPASIVAMSLDKCDKTCRRRSKRYMGLQLGMECWCGDSFGRHGPVEDELGCNLQCEGMKFEYICGGRNKIVVYELK